MVSLSPKETRDCRATRSSGAGRGKRGGEEDEEGASIPGTNMITQGVTRGGGSSVEGGKEKARPPLHSPPLTSPAHPPPSAPSPTPLPSFPGPNGPPARQKRAKKSASDL